MLKSNCVSVSSIIFVTFLIQSSRASTGDFSPEQQICVGKCEARNCSGIYNSKVFRTNQPWYEKTLQWSCRDDCKYNCMWKTVELFHKSGRKTPQFNGKWPFVRLLGIQEPASTLFSLFNLGAHVIWLTQLRKEVPASAPMYTVWVLYGVVSLNAWLWSTIFHARDVDFTEKMDYFSAFSIVTYSLMAFLVRFFGGWTWQSAVSTLVCMFIFLRHIYVMAFINFDYGYNMKVNIAVGLLNSICWFVWCYKRWQTQPHVSKAALAVFLLNLSMVFEIFEFEPILWTFDSHALWHLATAPIHGIWYKFVIADCLYLFDKADSHPARKII